jgi:hypothetical protein
MQTFKKQPTIRMLAIEVKDTTVVLKNADKEQFEPSIYLTPTGAEANRVLIAGTAIEKEDIGTDSTFFRLRVADPTGAVFVYAGQYQPEAAKAIKKLNVPCFVIVSGKISHYMPEGGDTIVSVRAESISAVDLEIRNLTMADTAHHTVKRLMEIKNDPRIKQYYPGYDHSALGKNIMELLDQLLEEKIPEAKGVAPKAAPKSEPPVKDAPKPPADAEKKTKPKKKEETKKATTESTPKDERKEPPIPPKPEPPKEVAADQHGSIIQDSKTFVLDILKKHKQTEGISKDTIQNVTSALGYGMLDVTGILDKLKAEGEIVESKPNIFKVIP